MIDKKFAEHFARDWICSGNLKSRRLAPRLRDHRRMPHEIL
jgi:hypothetical protein